MSPAPHAAIVDAFTRVPGQGNRAGVVLDARGLDDGALLDVARAIAASETAFVLPARGADLALRYFTPSDEIDFCGHATVATFHRLAESGALAAGRHSLSCKGGRLAVEIEGAEGAWRIWIETPRFPWTDSPWERARLMELLGSDERALDPELPIQQAGPKLFVPLRSRQDVWAVTPRWDDLEQSGVRHGVWGFFVFSRETLENGHAAHGRFFAPAKGVREDPVTGSAQGPLAEYLALHGLIALPRGGGTAWARAEQGDAMGKPGRVELEVSGAPGRIERVRIGGVAVTVMEGVVFSAGAPSGAPTAR